MADNVVSFVLENLSRLVAHEANLLCGVEDKVRSLESELRMMNAFLKSCQQNQQKKEIEQEVVRQFTDVAHDAEDVIDTFVTDVVNQQQRSWFSRMLHGVDHAKMLHHVAEKIDNIKVTIDRIFENRIKYDTQEAVGSSTDQELQLLDKRRRNVEEDDVVGFEYDTTEVISMLKQGGSRRHVVSIIGMGGLGKTTLARKIYNSDDVKNCFQCCAWVSVSTDYRPRELLHALLKSLKSTSSNASYYRNNSSSKHKKKSNGKRKADSDGSYSLSDQEELQDEVQECLEGKRYLIVLDDIWKPEDWNDIQSAFPDDNKSSRILITSRVREVASCASPSPPYYLPFLSEEKSWELFSKRVFRGQGVPSHLKLLGEWMVKSCGGLPLSIVVLAGILANKEKSYRVWSKIMGHVNSYLARPETKVHDIVLKLSYDSLPEKLKPCFLYVGMFPEDQEISVRRLILLWVAEGFIPHGDLIVEEAAEECLDELIDRSLIQVGRRRSDGGIKTCRIHDLLRELCIYQGKKEKFFEVCRDADTNLDQNKPRRLSIQCKMIDFLASENKDLSATRSLLGFDCSSSYKIDSSMSKGLVGQIKLVRVLGLRLPISSHHKIPNDFNMSDFNRLVHLRYLRLHIDGFASGKFRLVIINSICNLWYLETLELRGTYFDFGISFSSGICKLKKLRHLVAGRLIILPEQSSDVESKTMLNLQTLSDVVINKKSAIFSLIGKGVFPNLRKLGLCYDEEEKGVSQVGVNLRNLNYLNTLKIDGFSGIPTPVNALPSNLTKLTISGTDLNDDVMSTLGSLNNLRILKLRFCYFMKRLCSVNGFPKLEVFQMELLLRLDDWELGKDVMPCLIHLVIEECQSLTALPDELWSLTSLREVKVVGSFSESLKKQLQRQPLRDGCNLIIPRERERERERE